MPCDDKDRLAGEPAVMAHCSRNQVTAAIAATAPAAPSGLLPMATAPVVQAALEVAVQGATRSASTADGAQTTTAAKPAIETSSVEKASEAAKAAAAAPVQSAENPAAADCKGDLAKTLARTAIGFASTSARLPKDSPTSLDKLAAAIKACDGATVTVIGTTDAYGDTGYNLMLSRKRAETVREALIDRGVARSRISAKGLGEAKPGARAALNGSRNRRIAFTLGEPGNPIASNGTASLQAGAAAKAGEKK